MSLRAFLIGLLAVAGLSLLAPYASFIRGYGWLTTSAFPTGPVVIVAFLTVGLNVLLKIIRRHWGLRQAELMLVWCMLIVAAAIPVGGIGRYWYAMIAGGPYLARRADVRWEQDGSLTHAPAALVLSTNPKSEAARQFYEGAPGRRVPWNVWLRPLIHWGVFLLLFYLGILFACGLLRRQWVEVERLMFPLARVPLEFTEGSGRNALLPSLFTQKAFVTGVVVTTALRAFRALPVLFGAAPPWQLMVPLKAVFQDTPLEHAAFDSFPLMLPVIGLAYLVPADVSLSVWFFYLFSRFELLAAHGLALPEAGGSYGPLMRWQQFGAYIAFFGGTMFLARRHLAAVVRKAFSARDGPDDSAEPVTYRLGFWGFLICMAGCIAWYLYHGMRLPTALVVLALMLISSLVYARIVAQGGLPLTENTWVMHRVLEGIVGISNLSSAGAVIATIQSSMLVTWPRTILAPMAMNAFRISSAFRKRKRLLVPALVAALVVAITCTTIVVLYLAYREGSLNFSACHMPTYAFNEAQRIIKGQTTDVSKVYYRPLVFGMGLMGFLIFMRARFYWWPVHAVGLLCCPGWNIHRLWFPFFLGWLIKIGIMKFVGGRMMRQARYFFIALIVTEGFFDGTTALLRAVSHGVVPRF